MSYHLRHLDTALDKFYRSGTGASFSDDETGLYGQSPTSCGRKFERMIHLFDYSIFPKRHYLERRYENEERKPTMKCAKCGKETYKSTTTEAIELGGGCLLVIRNIPCFKCEVCDEIMYTGDIVEQLESITETARKLMQELVVVDFTKAA